MRAHEEPASRAAQAQSEIALLVEMRASDVSLNVLVAALKRYKGTGEINSDKIFYLTRHF